MKESEKGEDKKERTDKKMDKKEDKSEESSSSTTWILVGIVVVLLIIIAYNYNGFKGLTGKAISEEEVEAQVIKIGFMAPLTGDAASYGQSIRRGVDLAFKEANLENVEIVYEDSKCEGKEAVSSINKLINVDGVVAIVGEVCSGATLAAAPIAESNNVAMISSSSTSPKITESGDYIFRTVPSDALQGAFAANLMFKDGRKKLAILYSNEEYGVGFKEVLEKTFRGNVTAAEAFERGATDLKTQLTKIKESKPDAIFIVSNSPDASVVALKQIKELKIAGVKLYGSEGLKGPELAGTKEAEGLVVTSVTSGTFEFDLKYREAYDEAPGPFAAQAYDAMSALARAMKKGADTGEEIKNELYSTTFDGASGRISFDLNGDVSGNYEVYQLKKGEWVRLE